MSLALVTIFLLTMSVTGYDHLRRDSNDPPFRILHIVTTLAEYNNGRRKTIRGQDRLQELLIPVLKRSVESMISVPNWEVDVYLICGFSLRPERKRLVIDALPDGVGLEVWDNATPLGYDRNDFTVIQPITRCLARQHRYVLKDKLNHYDFFTVFEDDMLITKEHVTNFIEMSHEIERLKNDARPGSLSDYRDKSFHGRMTALQLQRVIPGFIRAEVLKAESEAQDDAGPIPVDHEFSSGIVHLNPAVCCRFPSEYNAKKELFPADPQPEDLMVWETSVKGLSVRQFPPSSSLGWVALQPAPSQGWKNTGLKSGEFIGGYWSGEDGDFGHEGKPSSKDPKVFGQQGGFMASREQILFFDTICTGAFLPPFEEPVYKDDGLYRMNVEFFSGGFQLFGDGKGACNLQRIISLDPDIFSKQILYHSANNKQIQINKQRRIRMDDLLGQLNTVKKRAERKIH